MSYSIGAIVGKCTKCPGVLIVCARIRGQARAMCDRCRDVQSVERGIEASYYPRPVGTPASAVSRGPSRR